MGLFKPAWVGKNEARAAALREMRLPDDRDVVVACLSDHSAGKPVKLLASRLLPDDDTVLDERCCPDCGTVGSVERTRWWSEWFENYQLEFECMACKRRGGSGPEGYEPVDFSITLRELRDM